MRLRLPILLVSFALPVLAACGPRETSRAVTVIDPTTSTVPRETSRVEISTEFDRSILIAPPTTTTVPPPPPAPIDYHDFPDWPTWRAIGRCEQPRADRPDGIWWDRPGKYPGGLGILTSSWRQFAPAGFPAGNLATPAQQIEVARAIRARFGLRSPWACARKLGL